MKRYFQKLIRWMKRGFRGKGDEGKGTLTINIQGDFMNSETFIDALVEKINAAEKKIKE